VALQHRIIVIFFKDDIVIRESLVKMLRIGISEHANEAIPRDRKTAIEDYEPFISPLSARGASHGGTHANACPKNIDATIMATVYACSRLYDTHGTRTNLHPCGGVTIPAHIGSGVYSSRQQRGDSLEYLSSRKRSR